MKHDAITLAAFAVAIGLSLSARAGTIDKMDGFQAAAACQGALPNYEGSFRKRPLAVANEGVASAFLTCATPAGGAVKAASLLVTNRSVADADMYCTLVHGLVDRRHVRYGVPFR